MFYHHWDLGFAYEGLAEWLSVGLNFRQMFEQDSKGIWRQENRPHLNVILKGNLFDCSVSNRSRLEYRDKEVSEDLWRYRNKTTLKFPFELTALKLQPYVADEVFIDAGECKLSHFF